MAASTSDRSVLVYISDLYPEHQLIWFDRSGKEISRVGTLRQSESLALSPDGKTVALARPDLATQRWLLWLRDLTRDAESRFTAPPQSSYAPVWSPDGSHIAFTSDRDLYLKDANGDAAEPLLQDANEKIPSGWSADGRYLLYTEIDPKTQADIWIVSDPLNKTGNRKAAPFLRTPFSESEAQFSPDGHWIAYTSNESGVSEIYLRPFPSSGAEVKWQVSSARATQPRWSPDGKELFFLEGSNPNPRLMDVPIQAGSRPIVEGAVAKSIFAFRAGMIVPERNSFTYSPSPDGQRFLISAYADQNAHATLNVLVNWEKLAKSQSGQ